jgi:2-oxoglutarate ferredoxin oxidoreductase subunit beta
VYKLQDAGHKTDDRMAAMEKAMEAEKTNYEKLPIGVFYKENRPTYEDSLTMIREKSLVEQQNSLVGAVDLSDIYEDLE